MPVVPGIVKVNAGGSTPIQIEARRGANACNLPDLDCRDTVPGFPVFKALLCGVNKP